MSRLRTRRALSLSMVLAIGVAATAFNMRAAIVGLGPLLDAIREDFGISTSVAGLLTTLPVVCFGTLAGAAPVLARRFGIDRVIWFTMVGLTVGILVRTGQSLTTMFVGTAIIGGSIALANVLVPAVIKRDFSERTGLMTGVYTMCLTLGGALSAGLMVPIVENTSLGWRGALGLLAIPSLVAVVLLLPRLRLNRERHTAARQEVARPRLWRNRLAWYVSLFMGLQSFVFFGVGSWMAVVLADSGLSDARAGLMWSLCNAAGLPASMLVPMAAQRMKDQRPLMLAMAACWVVAVVGLLVAPATWTIVWMGLFGIGGGSALSLALMFIVLRSPDTAHAAALSGMAQAIGYCLAAFAPFLFGALHDLTGGWEISLVMILVAIGAMVITGWVAGQRRLVAVVQPGV